MSNSFDASLVTSWMQTAAGMLREACPELTELDAARGDADHGVNMERGFKAIADELSASPPPTPENGLLAAASVLRKTTGGTSGALWAGALRRAGKAFGAVDISDDWALLDALEQAAAAVTELGGAKEGDNTLLDALLPATRTLRSQLEGGTALANALAAAVQAAEEGAAATAGRAASKGRASYLGERGLGTPDPGAVSAVIIVKALHAAVLHHLPDAGPSTPTGPRTLV